ncbi:type III pantothenate kinase [Desulfovibrio inopinatus]|uniref:type III pantothenate kinase n=1 Tax=Desulfovibrio inopinatus TaxID=102109 RepID=UPI000410B2CE|nr:type III pantothenate kinase [Desulfovibrio inopinatus]
MNRIVLADVGNTNVKLGITTAGGEIDAYVIPTDPLDTADNWGLRLLNILRHADVRPEDVEAVLVSSVVPPMDPLIDNACRRFLQRAPLFVPKSLPVPLNNCYERPYEVGADRLVTAYAARRIHPEGGLIVIDFGTATTFECVRGNDYLGGLICPGVLSSAQALSSRTAKLPQITLEPSTDELTIGKSTSESLNQGLVFGFAAMVDGIATRLTALLDSPVTVTATGGFAAKLAPYCERIDDVQPDLLLGGLRRLYLETMQSTP